MPVRFLVRRGVQNTQKRAYILADNRLAEKAGWDEKILAVELQGLLADGFEVVLTGFEAPDIDVGVFLSSSMVVVAAFDVWSAVSLISAKSTAICAGYDMPIVVMISLLDIPKIAGMRSRHLKRLS
jgi:hypothetical protein